MDNHQLELAGVVGEMGMGVWTKGKAGGGETEEDHFAEYLKEYVKNGEKRTKPNRNVGGVGFLVASLPRHSKPLHKSDSSLRSGKRKNLNNSSEVGKKGTARFRNVFKTALGQGDRSSSSPTMMKYGIVVVYVGNLMAILQLLRVVEEVRGGDRRMIGMVAWLGWSHDCDPLTQPSPRLASLAAPHSHSHLVSLATLRFWLLS